MREAKTSGNINYKTKAHAAFLGLHRCAPSSAASSTPTPRHHRNRLATEFHAVAHHSDLHHAAARGGLVSEELRFAKVFRPKRSEYTMGGAGHGIFVYSRAGAKKRETNRTRRPRRGRSRSTPRALVRFSRVKSGARLRTDLSESTSTK